jgi:two-component system, chemotaxis family, chemotaxis protein CheY
MTAIAALDILLVDDHGPTRAIIERTLRAAGAQNLRMAEDAHEALALLAAKPADVLITDLTMPTMSGIELIAALRADPRLAHARALLVTGHAGMEAEASAAGADAVLAKPVDPEALLRALEAARD